MSGWKRIRLLGVVVAVSVAGAAVAQVEPNSPSSLALECSRQADARGLHGPERSAFRKSCKTGATAPATHSVTPREQDTAATKRESRPPQQTPLPLTPRQTESEHRVALVLGNSTYKNVPSLPNPERDAAEVADALRATGFEKVTLRTNLGRDQLIQALRTFATQAERADWSVIYYAGHGIEVGGVNYLIPVDATIGSDRDMSFEAIALDQVLNVAERARKLRLVVLDACRNNPFAARMKRTLSVASRSVSRGLAPIEPDAGTLVVFAAKDGEVALDGDGAHSPFTTAFVKDIRVPGLEVRRLFDTVRDDVIEMTGGKQKPFSYGSVSGRQDFYFVQK
ncbi:caspase family protein [Bradyrhizobium sp. 21]|uniref:caspase family protein n=1 Tax=Bradyrhizobium sp. 21 TaxID=2782666 RepID=UPI001FFA834C|nr:caspase family protein [Bradyrhizobium sp. 21]MCK1385598.1 caspase family protein [Bradyrhizobium sp. 21]